jgi:hypothetical protein
MANQVLFLFHQNLASIGTNIWAGRRQDKENSGDNPGLGLGIGRIEHMNMAAAEDGRSIDGPRQATSPSRDEGTCTRRALSVPA